jgi:hypothetical protein
LVRVFVADDSVEDWSSSVEVYRTPEVDVGEMSFSFELASSRLVETH